jgi:hypothetical protein
MKKLAPKEFENRANKIHQNIYDYSLVKYINGTTHVKIICRQHGIFSQTPKNHLKGTGCPKCGSFAISLAKTKSVNTFLKDAQEIHFDEYDYSLVEYKHNQIPIKIICRKHGIFEQMPTKHLQGHGCLICGEEKRAKSKTKSTDIFIKTAEEIHQKQYGYSLVEYKNARTNVKIICFDHGIFNQMPDKHLQGHGCSKCKGNISRVEIQWLDLLKIPSEYRQKEIIIGKKRFKVDAFDSITNTIYEFNGDFWHGNPKVFKAEDINNLNNQTFGELYQKTLDKQQTLISAGYKVISIWENDFKIMKRKLKI